ncbi:hypothetical protein [Methylobacterium fujisawaense]|uniref:hypothetical protein n=1 Tax=Methylobacterium fujisawaense TaxID=107400 RepID=UPI0024495EB0|nr:hypothetical protein [Methylobacterium fujisawaense]MDH3031068.1 hypothetical protein [Methylobacterium fujisawaense]
MDTAPDPLLDKIWPPELRAGTREACVARAIEAADAIIAKVPPEHLEAFKPDVFRSSMVADWLRDHDRFMDRARTVLGAPEAAGREHQARRLIEGTKHSALAIILILRGADADVAALPIGAARVARLAAIRGAAQLEAAR